MGLMSKSKTDGTVKVEPLELSVKSKPCCGAAHFPWKPDEAPGEDDVRIASNPGSFPKAIGLLRRNEMKFVGDAGGGAVDVVVPSEEGKSSYVATVSADQKAKATCTCHDFRRRRGLCKHGAAAILWLASINSSPRVSEDKVSTHAKTPPCKRERLCEPPLRSSCKGIGVHGETMEAAETPAKVPCLRFPEKAQTSTVQRRPLAALRTSMSLRLLRSHAADGNAIGFEEELKRWERNSLDDVADLLHRAVLGHRPDGSCSIVKALVARSDGAAVVNAVSNRRTPLHVAVAAGRAEICRILVEHKADTLAPDSAGQTPLQLAQKRPKDCSSYRDDPIVELLRKATPKLSR